MKHSLPIREVNIYRLSNPYQQFFKTQRVELRAILGFNDPADDLNDPLGNIKRIAGRGIVAAKKAREGFAGITHAVDSTSGNYGPALAAALREDPDTANIKAVCVVSKTLPKGKLARLEACGAEIVFAENQLKAMDIARDYGKCPGYWYSSQYGNKDNEAAFVPYGENLARQLPHLGALAAGIGTGGTFIGLSRGLRSHLDTPAWELFTIAGIVAPGHSIPGMRTLEALKQVTNQWQTAATRIEGVDLPTALAASSDLKVAGIPGGPSSGASLEALYQGLRSRSPEQLKAMRNGEEKLVAAFVCADRWEIYADLYEKPSQ